MIDRNLCLRCLPFPCHGFSIPAPHPLLDVDSKFAALFAYKPALDPSLCVQVLLAALPDMDSPICNLRGVTSTNLDQMLITASSNPSPFPSLKSKSKSPSQFSSATSFTRIHWGSCYLDAILLIERQHRNATPSSFGRPLKPWSPVWSPPCRQPLVES